MKKYLLIVLSFLFIQNALANNDQFFCCKDRNYQQDQLHEFDTGHGTNFNGPPGPYLKKSTGVEYDPVTTNMLAYVEDQTGRTSYFASHYHVGHCQTMSSNDNGFLECGD